MHKQFYPLHFFLISLLLSACISNTANAQTITVSMHNSTTGGSGSTVSKGNLMTYTITTTNTNTSNITNSTVTGIVPPGTSYNAGSTKVNGVSVSDVNGKMPFTGSGGLINSPSADAGVVAPGTSAVIEFQAVVTTNAGKLNDYAILQATTGSGTVVIQSNTVTSSVSVIGVCTQIYQSTAIVSTQGGTTTYPFNFIRSLNTTNGTGVSIVFGGVVGPCYDAITGASLTAGTVLTDAEAIAYDVNTFRIYFINGTSNSPAQELCCIDQTRGPAALRFTGYPLETNTGTGYNINRMTFGSDGYGYALTANALDLIRFSVAPTTNIPTITSLGALINDANNGSNDVLAETGGDMFADASGKLYLIPNSGKMYRIDPATSIATYMGTISGVPAAGINSVGTDQNGYIYISGAYQAVYRVDLSTMTAVAINSGTTNVWKNGDYTSCITPILAPSLNITKSFTDLVTNSSTVIGGDPIQYTITISNTGNIAAAPVKLYDAIPTYAHYMPGSTRMNGVAVADIGGAMPFSVSGGQPINSTGQSAGIVNPGTANNVVITFLVTTDQYKTVCNQAVLTFNDADGNIINLSSDDPSKPGMQDATCLYSDGGVLCPGCRVATSSAASVKVLPNPFVKELNVQLKLNTAQQVKVRLIDFYGRTVYISTSKLSAGYNSLHIDAPAGLAPGIYVLELSAGNNRLLQKKLVKQ